MRIAAVIDDSSWSSLYINKLALTMEDFEKCDDFELIEWIEYGAEYPDESKKACEILYKRHGKPLFKLLRKILGRRGVREDELLDLVQDTFFKIYSKRKSCKRGGATGKNSFLYWLARIAQNIYNDSPESHAQVFSDFDANGDENETEGSTRSEKFIDQVSNPNADQPFTPNEDIIIEYVQGLPERDREIILAYYDNYDPDKNTPHSVLEELAERHHTTIEYICVLRARLVKKIKSQLSDKILVESKTARK